jgi:hypothetical protein
MSAAAPTGDFAFMFGGASTDGVPLNDLWQWTVKTRKWSQIIAFGGFAPSPRWLGGAASIKSKDGVLLVIHGGTDGVRLFDDILIFNAQTATWIDAPRVGDSPFARMGHTMLSISFGEPAAAASSSSSSPASSPAAATKPKFMEMSELVHHSVGRRKLMSLGIGDASPGSEGEGEGEGEGETGAKKTVYLGPPWDPPPPVEKPFSYPDRSETTRLFVFGGSCDSALAELEQGGTYIYGPDEATVKP